ncbi:hypothetical protein [Nitrosopumilus sp.]|uniref:hypothetical protein n=1 Tax=Nitrosopumilus sp. TaxID=2024843 RepID=UPI0029317D3E|nr:hypothetical protein [Nitrosopumilus sp.]
MKKIIPIFVIILIATVSSGHVIPSSIYAYSQEKLTDKETLKVKLTTEPAEPQPGEETRLDVEFINPQTEKIQEHIDYTIKIENNGDEIFGPIPLTHVDSGSVSIPVILQEGKNVIIIGVEAILFQPIPKETAIFDIVIGDQTDSPSITTGSEEERKPDPYYLIEWNYPFSLHLNQTAHIPSYDIQITFSKILEDSRCPSDVQCVWEGNVQIQLDILKEERKLKSIDLSLGADDNTRIYLLDKFYLELIQVEPYPTSSSSDEILPSDYSAVFVVEPQTDDNKEKNDNKEEELSSSSIPLQFRNHAALWLEGLISDDSFVQSIESLIKEKVIAIPFSYTVSDSEDNITREIPQWVKNNVDWWLQGLILDDVFLQNIEYLIKNEIIIVVISS